MTLSKTAIGTRSGGMLDFENPTPDMIDPDDLAICLSRLPRFAGHTLDAISVAQHSVMVCDFCSEYPLEALLHDAPEAYMQDCPRPLKRLLGQVWYDIEDRIYKAVARRFGALEEIPELVKKVDDQMLFTERRDQQPFAHDWGWYIEPLPIEVEPWGEERARTNFRNRLEELRKK